MGIVMGIAMSESGINDLYKGKMRTIRWQRCLTCNRPLAAEVSNHIGFEGEYWIVDSVVNSHGIVEHYFKRSGRWFGNHLKCPSCGRQGKLPQDKPLNWDEMQKTREGKNAIQGN